MSTVNGTSARDFIHRVGDGRVVPAGYTDLTGVTIGDDVINAVEGDDILFGDDGNDTLNGGDGNDTLNGGDGNDILDGGADLAIFGLGADTMTGGLGNDTYYASSASDEVIEAVGGGTDTIYATDTYNLAAGQEVEYLVGFRPDPSRSNTLRGNEFNNTLISGGGWRRSQLEGRAGDDTLIGGTGNDVLDGGLGADVMTGGRGSDLYYVDNAGDQINEAVGGGDRDEVRTNVNYVLPAGQEIEFLSLNIIAFNATLGGNEFDNYLVGRAGDDTLNGGDGDDTLHGGTGADVMAGATGDDTYFVDNAGDQVIEAVGEGNDWVYSAIDYALPEGQEIENLHVGGTGVGLTLAGNEFDNTLVGSGGNDTFIGGAGNDTLYGYGGDDTLIGGVARPGGTNQLLGGTGADAASYAGTIGVVHADLVAQAGYVDGVLVDQMNSIENLVGGSNADTLIGDTGANMLDGGAGADTMAGATGNDAYFVDNAGDQVIEAVGGGTDTVYISVDYVLATGQEVEILQVYGSAAGLALDGNEFNNTLVGGAGSNTLNGDAGDDTINGDAGDDALDGGAGNDRLDGGVGADVMAGATGDDAYFVDDAGDQVIEAVGGGNDTAYATTDYALAAGQEVETLRAYGTAAGLALDGNELGNTLVGSTGSNTLNGGAGDDTLHGLAGDDTLDGGVGNDRLDGGIGADIMAGATGDDAYFVDNAGDQIIEAVGGGNDTVYATADYALAAGQEVETLRVYSTAINLTLEGNEFDNTLKGSPYTETLNGGAGNDRLYGLAGDDTLNGGAGDDRLDGGVGADVMAGATGDDAYFVDNAGDQVIEAVGGGNDTVYATADYALAAGQEIETLRVYSTAINLTLEGNEFDNTVIGGAGADTLIGGAGDDQLRGGGGADHFRYGVDDGSDRFADFNGAAGDRVDLFGVILQSLVNNVATLSNGEILTAQVGYQWAASDFNLFP